MRETQVQSLGWEYLLEKEMATHSSTLAWRIPWMEEPGRLQPMGSQRVAHDFTFTFMWQLTICMSTLEKCQFRSSVHFYSFFYIKLYQLLNEWLNMWCHPTISSSFSLFSFCLQYFPASGSFPVSQLPADSIDMNFGKLQEMVKDREAWHTSISGVAKSSTWPGNLTTTWAVYFGD